MKYPHFFVVLSIMSLVAVSGCRPLKPQYKSHSLEPLNIVTADNSRTRNDVTLSVKSLDDDDQAYYFGKTCSAFRPIHLTIDNKSETTWVLSTDNISLPLAPPDAVARKYKASGWASFGLGAAFWALTPSFPLNVVLAPIAGITHGLMSYDVNKHLYSDIAEKNLENEALIDPQMHHNTLLFSTAEPNVHRFAVTLIDADNPAHTLQFNLTV